MNKLMAVIAGAGVGALMMYLFDPNGGTRRRALIRDKAVGLTTDAKQAFGRTAKDLGNRAKGAMHNAKSLAAGQSAPSQDITADIPA